MENELEVVNIRLVKEPSLYSEQTLDSPQAVVELSLIHICTFCAFSDGQRDRLFTEEKAHIVFNCINS